MIQISEDFTERVYKIRKMLYKIAYLYLQNETSALEAVDEAVYQAYRNLHSLKYPHYFNTWITRILINECKKELKRQSRITIMHTLPETGKLDYDSLPLKDAISKLPEELKIIIILRYFSDFTIVQTANILKLPQGTVATRQRKALRLLKLELEDL